MNQPSPKPEFPLDPAALDILRMVAADAAATGIECMIVGATARDILLTHRYGIPPRSATYDIDFAVAVESWEQFEQLRAMLAARKGFATSSRMKQRLYYGGQNPEQGYPVDLVPFGGIAQDAGRIAWPPDMKVIMNVAGYQEVLIAAEKVELAPGFVAKVASLPGLAILKLIAWTERGLSNAKDAHDLYQIMTTYADAGNADRLYNDEFAMLEGAGYDPEIAGACLLGKDAAVIANDGTHRQLLAILERDKERLATEMAKSIRHADDAMERAGIRLQQFSAGMMMRAANPPLK